MKVDDLKPAPYNPRKISDPRMKMLDKSMREFGDLSGVVFNVRSEGLIGGHQRVRNFDPSWPVVKEPVQDEVGTVALGYVDTPYGRWTYREVDWDEKKEIAANIAANKHGGEFDFPKLKDLLVEIDTGDLDMELVGFDQPELNDIFGFVKEDSWKEAMDKLPDGERPPFRDMTFTLHEDQHAEVEKAMALAKSLGPFVDSPNENSNGNALARICETFLTVAAKP